MSNRSLFNKEEQLAARAGNKIAADGGLDEAAAQGLLGAYQKLLRSSKRLMRLSDGNERALRNANATVEEKKRELESLSSQLSKFLAPQLYEKIFSSGTSVNISAERKRLTVFFSDLVGFTELSDRLEPEELTELLNAYLEAMTAIVSAHGGTIDKYMGDGLMVFFGDPSSDGASNDALACVCMAIEMQKQMAQLMAGWRIKGLHETMACRMGINTGYCTVGNFGSSQRMDYTIIGSAVNLAARLEAQAAPGGIMLSKSTHALVQHEIACTSHDALELKGFSHPVEVFEVVNATTDETDVLTAELAKNLMNFRGLEADDQTKLIAQAEEVLARLRAK